MRRQKHFINSQSHPTFGNEVLPTHDPQPALLSMETGFNLHTALLLIVAVKSCIGTDLKLLHVQVEKTKMDKTRVPDSNSRNVYFDQLEIPNSTNDPLLVRFKNNLLGDVTLGWKYSVYGTRSQLNQLYLQIETMLLNR